MDNAKFIELIGDYCSEALPPKDREKFSALLRENPNLAAFLGTYEETTELCNQVLKHSIPDGAQDRLTTYLKTHVEKLKT
tara:strand:+ start:336 stop:575 length:240 start_codon:yes stop_codon:yes gene_type:complete